MKTLKCHKCGQEYTDTPTDPGLAWLDDLAEYDSEYNRCDKCYADASNRIFETPEFTWRELDN